MGQLKAMWGEFVTGLAMLGRGFARYGRNPWLLFLGMIPAVISFALLGVAWFFLILFIDDLAAAVTWFADDWSSTWRGLIRFGAGAAILIVGALISILTYTALTLLIGDPFYEVISERIEEQLGGTPGATDLPWYRTFWKNLVDSVRLILVGFAFAVPLFFLGFIPVVGQTVVPVLNAIIGGWLITLELTGIPFNRRGLRLRDRRKLLRAHPAMTLGFGIPVFVVLLVPLAAIVVVPAAVAGSTLLTRRIMGLPTENGAEQHAPHAVAR